MKRQRRSWPGRSSAMRRLAQERRGRVALEPPRPRIAAEAGRCGPAAPEMERRRSRGRGPRGAAPRRSRRAR
eukprot:7850568-Pyramimonas_sp.AAC.1